MKKISGKYVSLLLVAVILCVAFFVRAYFPADRIFVGDWVKFSGTDAYFHMRLVDNIVANFPHITGFDPYNNFPFPGGMIIKGLYAWDWLMAAVIWLIGLGNPSQELVDAVGVYFPAVLGALTVVPVYFLGKELFNRWAGVIAAVLVALLPGEFLSRSILGFTENHVAETLFSTTAVLFLVMALKRARKANFTFEQLGSWQSISQPVIFALLGGFFIGLYFITWAGAELFVFIIFIFLIIQIMIEHLRGRSSDYLALVSVVFFFTLMVMYLGFSRIDLSFHLLPLAVALLGPPAMMAASRLMVKRGMKPWYFPLAILGLGVLVVVLIRVLFPDLFGAIATKFDIFLPVSGASSTTLEMRPFFVPLGGGDFFWTPAWLNLYTSLPLSIVAFFILAGVMWAKKVFPPERVLFLIWTLSIFIITVQQRRFDYYFTVNAGLLVGYISVLLYLLILLAVNYLRTKDNTLLWRQMQAASGFEVAIEKEPPVSHDLRKKKKPVPSRVINYFSHALAVLAIFFLVVFPGLGTARDIAEGAVFVPSDAWCASLTWLKMNSPEPFGDPEAYYRTSDSGFVFPETVYSIMSWWDYGYWITRISHRIPVITPSQYAPQITKTAGIMLSQDEAASQGLVRDWKTGYVIVDNTMVTAKFWAIAQWSGQDQSDFYGTYFVQQGSQLSPKTFYYPEYYRSLIVRLYNFDGKAVKPDEIKVIAYQDQTVQARDTGEKFTIRLVTETQTFPDYQLAVDYINSHQGDYRIVSDNPFVSAVPLEALGDYQLVFGSPQMVSESGNQVPEVKIFEVTSR